MHCNANHLLTTTFLITRADSFKRLEHLNLNSVRVFSIRLSNLKTLAIDTRLGDLEPCDCKKINCPSLVSFSYRLHSDEPLFGNDYVWNFPLLKKLKLNRCQSFIRNLKNLEVLIVLTFWRTDRQLLRELPRLRFLDVHRIDDGQAFGSLEDEFGERIQIHYRALPLRYARNRIRSILTQTFDDDDGWYFL